MQKFALATAIALLVVPAAHAWPASDAPPGTLADAADLSSDDAWLDSPFVETLRGAADDIFAGVPVAEAMRAAQANGSERDRDLYPLGDADGDGRADLLQVTWEWTDDGAEVTFRALSGRDGTALWEMAPDDDQYVFIAGDVDKDGVTDLVRVTAGSASTTVQPLPVDGGYSISYDEEHELLDGRDLSPFFSGGLRQRLTAEGTSVGASGVSVGDMQYRYQLEYLAPDPDLAGAIEVAVDLVHTDTYAFAFLPVGSAYYSDFALTTRLDLRGLDMEGNERWSAAVAREGHDVFATDYADYTGDGVRDQLFTFMDTAYHGVYAAGAFIPLDDGGFAVAGLLLDGATGEVVWEHAAGDIQGEALYLGIGDTQGEGREAVLLALEYTEGLLPGTIDAIQTRIVPLGTDGDPRTATVFRDELVVPGSFVDTDGDGRSEIGLFRQDVAGLQLGAFQYGIADASFEYIWTIPDITESYPLINILRPDLSPDLDGDGVPEILLVRVVGNERLEALDGQDGAIKWSHAVQSDGLVSVAFLPDIDDDGGMDLALIEFPEFTGGEEEDAADGPAFVELLRGSDLERIWRKQVHAPDGETSAPFPYGSVLAAGDVDGDGQDDVVLNLDTGRGGYICTPGGGCEEMEVDGRPLDIALPLDGLRGRVLMTGGEDASVDGLPDAEIGEAGKDLAAKRDTPVPLLASVAALGAALLLRRKE